jgi:cell division protein FtsB
MLDIVRIMPKTRPGKNPTRIAVAGNLLQVSTIGSMLFVVVAELEEDVEVEVAELEVEVAPEVEVGVEVEELEVELVFGATDWSESMEQCPAELQL